VTRSKRRKAGAWPQPLPHDPELLFRAGILYREIGIWLRGAELPHLLHGRESGHIDSLDVSKSRLQGTTTWRCSTRTWEGLPRRSSMERAALTEQPALHPLPAGTGGTGRCGRETIETIPRVGGKTGRRSAPEEGGAAAAKNCHP